MNMCKILVAGGAGFIGSHLCKKLIEDNNEVICLDNLFTGSLANIKILQNNKNFKFIQHDVEEPIDLQVDKIYNLACPASPPHYQYNPVKTIRTSVVGMANLLELAKKCNATILQASTSEIYGNPLEHPQKETYWGNVNPIGIRSCYDEGKRCAETLMSDYHRQYGIDTKIVRIFNTYGPNMHPNDGRVVSNFIIQALKNEDITIYGEGNQTRSFCYVDDLVNALIKMMNTPDFCGPVNIGNPSERTILQLAELIIQLTKSSSKIIHKPLPSDDPTRRKPDITLAKSKLNWEPTIDIEEGLIKTINYFKSILQNI
ncbi:MAG: SDR family oxidoreductase [Cyanobacteria bacterium SIG28]|nr:SDR family oxidoreductase [Cyanobacteria bacterium SIG28]